MIEKSEEYCSCCDSIIEIPPGGISPCPECGMPVVPCNTCDATNFPDACCNCKLAEWASIIREAL